MVLLLAAVFLMLGVTGGWAAPLVFNATESAIPGDVIYLQGDNFPTPTAPAVPAVYIYCVTGSESSLTPGSGTLLPTSAIQNFTKQLITLQVPPNMAMGLYALWVYDGSNYSAPVFINKARPTSFEYGQVSPSYTFRIFGRNLCLKGKTPTAYFDSTSYPATVVTTYPNDGNVLQITTPSNLPTSGTHTLYVSNGYGNGTGTGHFDVGASEQTILGRTGGADPFGINVPWAPDFAGIANTVINVVSGTNPHTGTAYGADASGATNSVNAIQQALYDAGNPTLNPNGAVVLLPSGTFLINYTGESTSFIGTTGTSITQPASTELVIPNNVVLEGTGLTTSTIDDATTTASIKALSAGSGATGSHIGMLNLTYQQTSTVWTADGAPPTVYGPSGTEVFMSNVGVYFAYSGPFQYIGGSLGFSALKTAVIENISLDHGLFSPGGDAAALDVGSYVNIRNNTLMRHATFFRSRILIHGLDNVVFENNHCTRDGTWPPVSTITDGGSIVTGTATSGSTTTLVQSSATWGTNAYVGQYMAITSGPGQNQTAAITANTATTLTFKAIKTAPGSGSLFSIGTATHLPYEQGGIDAAGNNLVFLNNIFDGINLPLTYENDGETILNQEQPPQNADVTPTVYLSGTSTGGGTKSLSDTTQTFPNLVGEVVAVTSGVDKGQWGTIASYTPTSVTVAYSTNWANVVPAGSQYSIYPPDGFDMGTIASATANTITDTSKLWNVNYFANADEVVAIVSGTGTGQWQSIVSNTATTVTLAGSWAELPDSTSHYAITAGWAYKWLVKGNTLQDQPRGIGFMSSYDTVVDDNILTDNGECITVGGQQRSEIESGSTWYWYGRMNLGWKTLVTDNIMLDMTGTYGAYVSGTSFFYNDGSTSSVFGAFTLGQEFRRNVLEAHVPNVHDGATASNEAYNIEGTIPSKYAFSDTGVGAPLGTILDDNAAINNNNAVTLSSSNYQTSIFDQMDSNVTAGMTSDLTLSGAAHASVGTVTGAEPNFCLFDANFTGNGTSTGTSGTGANLLDVGGTGTLNTPTNGGTASILSTTPFDSGSGSYLECNWKYTSGNLGATVQVTPTSTRNSWARIFDMRNGQWLINGGFDFFYRPVQNVTAAQEMYPLHLDSDSNPGGLTNKMTLGLSNTWSATAQGLSLALTTATGNGGTTLTGNLPSTLTSGQFQAGQIYHIGVTFSTDVTQSPPLTTINVYIAAGTGAMTETSGNLLATGTCSISAAVDDTNATDWFNGGVWPLGDSRGVTGLANINDYDGMRLYYSAPTSFPSLDTAAP